MTQGDKEDPETDKSEVAAKLAPSVYRDLLKPTARVLGATAARSVLALLVPVRAALWAEERAEKWVADAVQQRLDRLGVPHSGRVPPTAELYAATLAGLRSGGEDSPLRELFANLLTTGMQADSAGRAHPAFAEILRQLTAFEAQILATDATSLIEVALVHSPPGDLPTIADHDRRRPLAEKVGVQAAALAVENLRRLGLAELSASTGWEAGPRASRRVRLDREGIVTEQIHGHPYVAEFRERLKRMPPSQRRNHAVQCTRVALTQFGTYFVRACVAPDAKASEPPEP